MKPRSLSLDPTSKFRVQDPSPTGFGGAMLKLLGYYSKQSQLIRGANTLYSRISMQVDKPELYASESVITNTTLIHLHMCRLSHSLLCANTWHLGFVLMARFYSGAEFQNHAFNACSLFVVMPMSGTSRGQGWCSCGTITIWCIQPWSWETDHCYRGRPLLALWALSMEYCCSLCFHFILVGISTWLNMDMCAM
jgi:hypothetical protein